jgi:diguanylate cyclase (GGDEF)-like protein/PAS domain S-box-containing protein
MNPFSRIRRLTIVAITIWVFALALSYWWNVSNLDREAVALAKADAEANLKKDMAFRLWSTEHGGIYLRVDEKTKPSPFLANVPDRDVPIPGGGMLTLQNPAATLREILEKQSNLYGSLARITALKYLNPQNAPDEWEKKALDIIGRTGQDYSEAITINGSAYLRVMQPMLMEQGCVKCHAWADFKAGGVGGATDVAVPLARYRDAANQAGLTIARTHGGILLIGLVVIGFISRRGSISAKESLQYQEKLKASEKKFHLLFDAANDMLVLLDLDACIVDINHTGHTRLGYTKKEMIGKRIGQFNSPEFVDKVPMRFSEILRKGQAVFESAHLHKDGTVIPIEINARVVEVDGQKRVFSVIRDITERKREQRAMQIMKFSIDHLGDAVSWTTKDAKIVYVNEAFCCALGYSMDEMLTMSVPDFDPDFPVEAWPEHWETLKKHGSMTFESRHRTKDGKIFPVEVNINYLQFEGEEFNCAYVRNISARKKTEEELGKREARYRGVIETSGDGFWMVDTKGRLLEVNDAYVRLSGYSREELLGMAIPDIDAMMSPEEIGEKIQKVRQQGYARFETLHRAKDGKVWPVEVITSFWPSEGGLFFTFFKDITERRQAEARIYLLTRSYSALSQTSHALIECRNEAELFERICRIAVDTGGMKMAWIGKPNEEDGLITPVACYGEGTAYLDGIGISLDPDAPEGKGPTAIAFREAHTIIVQDYYADPMTAAYQRKARPYGWGAGASFPILRDGKVYAVLSLYHAAKNPFTPEIISLTNEMAINAGRGLDRFLLEKEKRQAEESMRLAALIYQKSAEGVLISDENNLIVDVNPAFTRQTGYTLEEIIGKNPKLMKSGRHDEAFYREMWRAILEEGHWQGEIEDRRKDGSLHFKLANISVIRHDDGTVYRHVAQFFDITDQKQKVELIWQQANFDPLTELPNRRLFHDRLEQEIKKAHRTDMPLALLFIDLDRFKEVNDTLGHAKGDLLLVEAARRIRNCVRDTDTVARLGGDEFTVIVPNYEQPVHLERIAQDIIGALSGPFDLGDGDAGYISASIGIALYPDDARNIDDLMKHADQAMYAAKTAGRNCFSHFTHSMQMEAQEKLALTNDLRHALSRDEIQVYYQPIIELATGRIEKAEALLRWHHPVRGMISPAVFIPLAEEFGLIYDIGDWVFLQAVSSVADWHKRFKRMVQVSVNRSPVEFDKDPTRWIDVLTGAGLPGGSITIEITEGLLLRKSEKVRQCLLEFRNHGIEVSIDDFGTGFSALSYLKQFDIDYLKIDRSFVNSLTENDSDKALVEAIIVMAHKLGIKTIAEGVETEAQRDMLLAFDCDYAQGYLYSRPVPVVEFERLLNQQKR